MALAPGIAVLDGYSPYITDWRAKLRDECLKVPGTHLLELGITGSGKTQGLYYLLEGLKKFTRDNIIWFDSGKSSEWLNLLQFGDVNVMLPYGCKYKIDDQVSEKSYTELPNHIVGEHQFKNIDEIWLDINKKAINVVMIEPFIVDPVVYTYFTGKLYDRLIRLAHDYQIQTPLTIFYDEFHRIAPGQGHGLNDRHYSYGAIIQHNIERLRSLGVRFMASSQGWTKIRKGVRSAFTWHLIKRGAMYERDQPKLARFNAHWETLRNSQGVLVNDVRRYSDDMKLDYYGDGNRWGRTYYYGEFKTKYTDVPGMEEKQGQGAQVNIDLKLLELLARLNLITNQGEKGAGAQDSTGAPQGSPPGVMSQGAHAQDQYTQAQAGALEKTKIGECLT